MADLLTEVARFRDWADEQYPPEERHRYEWEIGYGHWSALRTSLFSCLESWSFQAWSEEELQAILYVVARDNEGRWIASEIRQRHPNVLLFLAQAAYDLGEPEARFQFAFELGRLGIRRGDEERLLLLLARDEDEYVRRMALQALSELESSEVEKLALETWHRPDDAQQWARMMALDCLSKIGSPHLEPLLAEAERDEREHLRRYAQGIRGTTAPQ